MFTVHRSGDVVEIYVAGDWPRDEYVRACAEAMAIPGCTGILFDLRGMTNAPGPGRGAVLAAEVPALLPRRRVAFLAQPNTTLYGVLRQITAMTKGDLQLFTDEETARAWLAGRAPNPES
jgi:hypothetical protein